MPKQSRRFRLVSGRANRAIPPRPIPTMHIIETARVFKSTNENPRDPNLSYEGS
jgi:hypothetical protein